MDLASFRLWLQTKHYQPNTIRNYIADITAYLASCQSNPPFSQISISNYLGTISAKNNYRRYLASLNKFCQFGLDQKLITANPLKKVLRQQHLSPRINLDQLLEQYQTYLQKNKVTQVTIKNYLMDIKQFFNWTSN